MAEISTVNVITESGLAALSFTSASGSGDKFQNDGRLFVACKNGNAEGDAITFTFTAQVTSFDSPQYGDATKANATLAVEPGQIGFIGPFAGEAFNDSDNNVNISYSATTSVSVAICSFM